MTFFSFLGRLSGVFLTVLALTSSSDAADILFLGGNATPTAGADAGVMNYLENRYGAANVDYLQSSQASSGDETGYDVLVISSTPSSDTIRGKFQNSTVGIINWERVTADDDAVGDFAVTDQLAANDVVDQSIRITDVSSPITDGFTVGQVVQLVNGTTSMWWSVTQQAPGASSLAEKNGDNTHQFLTIVDQGGILLNGAAAAGRRVMFGMRDATFDTLTDNGQKLFGQAVDWAAGGVIEEPDIPQVKPTQFSPARGYYQSAIDVAIATDTSGAAIYYTTDGMPPVDTTGTPTATATLYTDPIPIHRTATIRAVAVKSGLTPTGIDAHTYILLDIDTATTDGTDFAGLNTPFLEQSQPAGWGNLASGDFNMDPAVSKSISVASGHSTSTAQTMLLGLRDIPTVSISMNRDDFSGVNGIYSNPEKDGDAWERACSAEFIPAKNDPRPHWQENCGLRIQGGASRKPLNSPKHSLSFRFRADYGAAKLHQPLFPDSSVEEFNVIALRAGYNNSWIHRDASQRNRGSMIRDQWIRESVLDMGNPSAGHGFMVHLFVNGLYWGVHNLCERQDASHYAAYNEGDEELLDALNGGAVIDGDKDAWNEISGVVDSGDWSKIQQVIDINHYIDYQIINRYGGNADLQTSGNWRAAGGGPFPIGQPEQMAPWQLYPWDSERTLESQTSTISPIDPMSVRATLENNPEYRMRFADRLQKHFFNAGALTPDACAARWMKYANHLDRAIIAESARWGDHRRTPAYTRDNEWLGEQNRLVTSYFPVRSAHVLNGYGNLFPDTDAPVFRVDGTPMHGGEIPLGGILSITATSGTIYYTTDGSDPRLVNGGINPNAISISSGTTVPLTTSGLVCTRAQYQGEWSALEEASFYIELLAGPGQLAISEIHYNPYRATAQENIDGAALLPPRIFDNPDDFEFIEIQNISPDTVNLDEVRFSEGIDYTFGNITLPSGGYAVVCRDAEAFAIRYPSVQVAGTYSGKLSNKGELIVLLSAADETLQSFTYDDAGPWPARPDGEGASLEIITPSADHNNSENWRASSEFNGSPGAMGSGPDGRIVINEVLSHTDLPQIDSIELHNTTGAEIDITGWQLSDSTGTYPSFTIPATTIPSGGYVVFDENDFNQTPTREISNYSGTLAAAPTTITTVTGHGLSTGAVITIDDYAGISLFNDSFEVTVIDNNHFTINAIFQDNHPTKGNWISGRPFALSASHGEDLYFVESNASGQPVGFVDHVEFSAAFHGESLGRWPNGGGTGTLTPMLTSTPAAFNDGPRIGPVVINEVMYHPTSTPEDALEFIELHNSGNVVENLANWRLRGGADFDFTSDHSIAAGGLLVIVAFDPITDTSAASTFRTTYGIDASIPLVGPFTDGPLGNDTGTVRLQRPDTPPLDEPTYYPQVTEDEVIYKNTSPWPTGPAGGGKSLNRGGADQFGNLATSWTGESPTPGGKHESYASWQQSFFGSGTPVGSTKTEDPDHDGIVNLLEYALGLHPLIHDPEAVPTLVLENDTTTLSYTKHLLRDGISYRVETSTDLVTWSTVANDTVISSINYTERRKAMVPLGSNPHLFMRLVVDSP